MESESKFTYQEGGARHPETTMLDLTKETKTELKEISKITGWWSDEGVLGLEVSHGDLIMKAMCEAGKKAEPPHCASLKMADREYLTEVIGQSSGKIERLTFRTSRGTTITFGSSQPSGALFKLLQKNHKVAALSVGVGEFIHSVGAYFAFVQFPSPPLAPKPASASAEAEEFKLEFSKSASYDASQSLSAMTEKKALYDPATYGKFDDYGSAIKSPLMEGKQVTMKEIMLYFSIPKKVVLGYRLKYEIRDPAKPTGKIVELKHVAPNPMTPTLHAMRVLDEGETIVEVKGKRNKHTDSIQYLEMRTSMGNVVEAGSKEESVSVADFELKGKEGENVIAFAGKVTDALNSLTVFGIK